MSRREYFFSFLYLPETSNFTYATFLQHHRTDKIKVNGSPNHTKTSINSIAYTSETNTVSTNDTASDAKQNTANTNISTPDKTIN
ncbi:hypothetical protein J2W43_000144 [Pseudomonas brassicacearum]|uniref:Uncharacterized protein n=1 Tax=Pseudomonas brassicacearum TaxID=930166 RepID=A0AAW8M2Y5_9PSED|nr:hypothetical protein [Pseudomonas brassicacearum]